MFRWVHFTVCLNIRPFVKIDRWFPSSKSCSTCGWIKQDLTLSIRAWVCGSCGE
ncbi:zinc ribbon domain-containing protein, partial [Algoriphagus resistens]|uniref:zinc ribbon domain-containing protein n=1 Tax=Algoriphagus resistens TaxID=1750590 RepID=UPI0012FCB84F